MTCSNRFSFKKDRPAKEFRQEAEKTSAVIRFLSVFIRVQMIF